MECGFSAFKIVGLVAAVALLGAGLMAGCRAHRRCGPGDMTPAEVQEKASDFLAHLERKIDATDDQKVKLAALKDRLMPDLLSMHASHQATAKELETLWAAPTLDAAALDTIADKKVEDFKGMERKLSQAIAELHGILTPEQRQKLQELHRSRCGH